jgi:hypothetical protein
MVSRTYLKLLGIALCCLLTLTFLTPSPVVVRADDGYTATQNGDWNSGSTWGGSSTPTATDAVTIPSGITVTIPNTVTVDRSQTTTVGGTLDNYGMMSNMSTLHITTSFTNYATFDNYGTITNDGTLTNNGTLTNDGTLDNNLTFANYGTLANNSIVTNDGTVNNNGRISLDDNVASTFTNNGTINNANIFYVVCGASYTGNLLLDKPGRTNCDGAILVLPEHRTHMTNHTPTFTWDVVAGADAYRIRVYNETRSYNTTILVNGGTTTSYTWQENLPVGKYFWRVRSRDGTIPAWSNFSKRNTLFID